MRTKNPGPQCTVYFDGDCPICSREINIYRRAAGGDTIAWIDASRCDDALLANGPDRASALRRFHVRCEDGTMVSGAAAFVAVWERLPAFSRVARICSNRGILALLEWIYRAFLKLRTVWYTPRELSSNRLQQKQPR